MTVPGSVSRWFPELLLGNRDAAQALWQRYFVRLVELARGELRNAPRGAADEEDVALSAFDTFFRNATAGQFPELRDRDDLWGILLALTRRKAINLIRHERRQKRDGDRREEIDWETQESPEPSPEFAAQVADEYKRLLELLDDDDLRAVAVLKMEGYKSAEVAQRLGYSERTVERKLRVIRSLWAPEEP